MEIRFAGQLIAQEPTEGGHDAITGFLPKRKIAVQTPNYIRAVNALPIARGNRTRSMSGTIVYGPFSGLAPAMQKLLTNYDDLPDAGALVITVGGETTIFGQAVLEEVVSSKRMGVTVAATLTFQLGPGTNIPGSSSDLTDEDGSNLTDESSDPLTS